MRNNRAPSDVKDTLRKPRTSSGTQVRLQRPNLAADGGLGHMQVLGGQRDAHAPPHGHEASDQIKRGQFGQWV